MRVWIVNHYAITPEQTGGTRHFNFARRLVERGHEATIFASNFDHFSGKDRVAGISGCTVEEFDGVRFVWVPTRAYSGNGRDRAMNMLDFARQVRGFPSVGGVGVPDVVYGSSPHLFGPYAAQNLASRLGVPFVLEVRDVWPQTLADLSDLSESGVVYKGLAWIERRLYRRSDHVVSLLPHANAHIASHGGSLEKVTWIPNGVESVDRAKVGPAEGGAFVVTYAGTHGLANGLDTVIDAAKLVAGEGVVFRLIGSGPQKDHLVDRARSEGVSNVEFLDAVPKSEVYGELAKSHAFVMLLKESDVFRHGVSPNKLFDYMVSRRPVIFAVNSSNSPVETAGCGLRIPPDNPGALAEAALHLKAATPEERAAMGDRGAAYVREHHDFDRLTDKLEAVLESVVRRSARS